MAEFLSISRLPRNAGRARQRRFSGSFNIPGSGQYNLQNIAQREILEELLSILSFTAEGLVVTGSVTSDSVDTNSSVVDGTLTADTVNTQHLIINGTELDTNGARLFGTRVVVDNDNHTVASPEQYIFVTTGGDNRTISLPQAITYDNTVLYVKKVDDGVGNTVVRGFESIVTPPATVQAFQFGRKTFAVSGAVQFQHGEIYADLNTVGMAPIVSYEQIDGLNTFSLTAQHAAVELVGCNTNWYVLSNYTP